MNHTDGRKAAKFGVHCTETRSGSYAESVDLCVQGTFSNLLPKLLKGKRCMHFVFVV